MTTRTQRSRARYVVLATVVLLVAMTGSATAARMITGKQIKDGSLTGRDLRNGSVTGLDIRDGSLTRSDVGGSLVGAPGPAGPEGPQGPAGPPGANGVSGYELLIADVAIPTLAFGHQEVACSPGKRVTGGGMSSSAPHLVRMVESAPLNGGVGWSAGMLNTGASTVTGYVWAVCVAVS